LHGLKIGERAAPKILRKATFKLLAARTCWENQNSFSSLLKCIKIR